MSLLASFAYLFLSRERLEVGSGIKDHLGVLSQLGDGRETEARSLGCWARSFCVLMPSQQLLTVVEFHSNMLSLPFFS